MVCWWAVAAVVVLEAMGLAWPGPAPRRGMHRSGSAGGAMRAWPGPGREDVPGR